MKKDFALEALLKQCAPPEIDPEIRKRQITQLSEDIRQMDYLPRQSFIGQIMTQLSFISGWIWLAQAGILFLIYFYVFQDNSINVNLMLFCLSPGLSLILTFELSKSFRADIWEMEAACRYNLAQILFFRLSILFGGDFLVLGGALVGWRMADGKLWQFCLYALLPFFLTSSLSLYVLRRAGSRYNSSLLAAVPITAGIFNFFFIPFTNEIFLRSNAGSVSGAVSCMTLLALALLIYNARKLCTAAYYLNEQSAAL